MCSSNVPSLVSAGTASGQRMRRNRRILQGSLAVASIAVVATVAGIGLRGGLFDNTAPPVKRIDTVQQLVPSNPRAFAAAVIADLPPGVTVRSVGQNDPFPGTAIHDSFLGTWPGKGLFNLSLGVRPLPKESVPVNCQGQDQETCSVVALPGGGRARLELTSDSVGVHMDVFAIRSHDFLDLVASIDGGDAAQAQALSRSVVTILRDPAVGMSTYPTLPQAVGATLPRREPVTDAIMGRLGQLSQRLA